MSPTCTYKLERYKSAFSDYEAAVTKFHEGVLSLTLNELTNDLLLSTLRYELDIKHEHLVQCANRMVGCR